VVKFLIFYSYLCSTVPSLYRPLMYIA
jgi:hypothetical protein